MSDSLVALLVISGIVSLGAFIGFYAGKRHKMDLEQWTVGGRGFGLILVWLLMAGEVYTPLRSSAPAAGLIRRVDPSSISLAISR